MYEVARKRGQRATYQNLRAAVEEASGRRFLVRRRPLLAGSWRALLLGCAARLQCAPVPQC